ncbi:MAG: YihA family ribosome biogenesis GTP-binding protein [Lachnospiraceae bacterium]|nr:YihA family ribosome biogenesis GTP-binding protein [Lachnospiraceae bacterium]
MIIKNVSLETVCGITSRLPENRLPENRLPEVAFAGKSNVGKSSLINALMNRKSLARTSSQPGKTQTINYYNINNSLYFVDLPGYGYARANEKVKAQWGRMVENYLHRSKMLRQVFLLIDIRHAPSENDRMMYDWILKNGYSPIIIATKLDKIKKSQIEAQMELIASTLRTEEGTVMLPFSSQTKQGRDEIYEILDKIMEVNP